MKSDGDEGGCGTAGTEADCRTRQSGGVDAVPWRNSYRSVQISFASLRASCVEHHWFLRSKKVRAKATISPPKLKTIFSVREKIVDFHRDSNRLSVYARTSECRQSGAQKSLSVGEEISREKFSLSRSMNFD